MSPFSLVSSASSASSYSAINALVGKRVAALLIPRTYSSYSNRPSWNNNNNSNSNYQQRDRDQQPQRQSYYNRQSSDSPSSSSSSSPNVYHNQVPSDQQSAPRYPYSRSSSYSNNSSSSSDGYSPRKSYGGGNSNAGGYSNRSSSYNSGGGYNSGYNRNSSYNNSNSSYNSSNSSNYPRKRYNNDRPSNNFQDRPRRNFDIRSVMEIPASPIRIQIGLVDDEPRVDVRLFWTEEGSTVAKPSVRGVFFSPAEWAYINQILPEVESHRSNETSKVFDILETTKRISSGVYNGTSRVDFRFWRSPSPGEMESSSSSDLLPTKRGVVFGAAEWTHLKSLLPKISEEVAKLSPDAAKPSSSTAEVAAE